MLAALLVLLLADVAPPPTPSTPSTPAAPASVAGPTARPAPPTSTMATTPPPAASERLTTPLMRRFTGRLVAAASSSWVGWPAERIVDGDPATSWFSDRGDAAAHGQKPWVSVTFPVDVTVKKVHILGNREPDWATGFTIHYGRLELLDDKGAVVARIENEGRNTLADIAFTMKVPVARVRTVRFTSLLDDGDQTEFADIALAELLVE